MTSYTLSKEPKVENAIDKSLMFRCRVMELFFDAAVVAPPQLAEMVLIILFIVTE